MYRFIDISAPGQGLFDMAEAHKVGAEGVIVQASHGQLEDVRYAGNVARARRAGLRVGHYHFYEGGDPKAEAAAFVAIVRKHWRVGDVYPAMDYETPPLDEAKALAFCQAVHAAFSGVGFYSSLSFIQSAHFGAPMRQAWLWLAAYQATTPPTPLPWDHAALWQNTDRAGGLNLDGDLGDMAGAFSSPIAPVRYRLDVVRGGKVITSVRYGGGRVRRFMLLRLRGILRGGQVVLRRRKV